MGENGKRFSKEWLQTGIAILVLSLGGERSYQPPFLKENSYNYIYKIGDIHRVRDDMKGSTRQKTGPDFPSLKVLKR